MPVLDCHQARVISREAGVHPVWGWSGQEGLRITHWGRCTLGSSRPPREQGDGAVSGNLTEIPIEGASLLQEKLQNKEPGDLALRLF